MQLYVDLEIEINMNEALKLLAIGYSPINEYFSGLVVVFLSLYS